MNERLVQVDLGQRGYPICIGRGLLQGDQIKTRLDEHILGRPTALLCDATVGKMFGDELCAALDLEAPIALPPGEEHKSLDGMMRIYDALMERKLGRDTVLLALGGGIVGDMTGFAAATWQRGIEFIQLPTTLLAMVDSSVGGKTGVNHPRAKNMIGAFKQPLAVIADTRFLETLPAREYQAGLAEVIKYGLIRDRNFFEWLEANVEALRARQTEATLEIIERSCRHKAAIVAEDERERGARALLNLGHTFGHAIEAGEAYRGMLHGEAVAVGMLLAARLSVKLGMLDSEASSRIENLLQKLQLPTTISTELSSATLLELMRGDKKSQRGQLRLVLLDDIGAATLADAPNDAILLEALNSAHG